MTPKICRPGPNLASNPAFCDAQVFYAENVMRVKYRGKILDGEPTEGLLWPKSPFKQSNQPPAAYNEFNVLIMSTY